MRHEAQNDIVVLKLGSSVLADPSSLGRAVAEIARHRGLSSKVVAVVSAMGDTTDRLLRRAKSFASPDPHAVAALLSIGEAESVALLCLALAEAGIPANPLDPGAFGLRTEGPALDAEIAGVDEAALLRALDNRSVLVVPGFLGRDAIGRTTCLGRGGSDLTALALAHALGARCLLLKDVEGIYDGDPAKNAEARRFEHVCWEDVLALEEGIVQHKAVRWARAHELTFEVGAVGKRDATVVGRGPTKLTRRSAGRSDTRDQPTLDR
jgi:aspartokinase